MRVTAVLVAATILGFAAPAPASAADYGDGGYGGYGGRYHHHHGYGGRADYGRHRHHHARFYAEEPVSVVEYREPYLPRGVLYNAPPLPLADAYVYRHGYRDVISARY